MYILFMVSIKLIIYIFEYILQAFSTGQAGDQQRLDAQASCLACHDGNYRDTHTGNIERKEQLDDNLFTCIICTYKMKRASSVKVIIPPSTTENAFDMWTSLSLISRIH